MSPPKAAPKSWALIAAALAAAFVCGVSGFAGARLAAAPDGAPDAVRAAARSVVTLYAERPVTGLMPYDPAAGPPPRAAPRWRWRTASGFAFAPGGWVVTNHHAVAGARTLEAQLADGSRVNAQIHALDPRRDLAVVRLDGAAPPPLEPSFQVEIGDRVFALGAPFDLTGSLSAGIVSGFERSYDGVDPVDYLQHDAALNPGNSGGPLLDRRGDVAGMNTAVAEPAIMNVGVSFAIPARTVFTIAERLQRDGTAAPPRLGVSVRSLDQVLAEAMDLSPGDGVIVDSIEAGSPADAAGLAAGDVLLSLDGASMGLPRDLSRALLARTVGESVKLVWRRGGARMESVIALAPGDAETSRVRGGGDQSGSQGYGLEFTSAGGQAPGARIHTIRPGSPAAQAGIRAGDRLLAVNGQAVADGVEASLRLAESGPAAAVRVLHAGQAEARHLGLARRQSRALSAPGQTWPDAAGGPY